MTATSRRGNVATSARVLHPSILKYGWLGNRGIWRCTKRGTNLQKQSDTDFEGVPGIVSLFICLDIFGYGDDVFNTRHFHLFFHYVLDLFLGLRRILSYVMD